MGPAASVAQAGGALFFMRVASTRAGMCSDLWLLASDRPFKNVGTSRRDRLLHYIVSDSLEGAVICLTQGVGFPPIPVIAQ